MHYFHQRAFIEKRASGYSCCVGSGRVQLAVVQTSVPAIKALSCCAKPKLHQTLLMAWMQLCNYLIYVHYPQSYAVLVLRLMATTRRSELCFCFIRLTVEMNSKKDERLTWRKSCFYKACTCIQPSSSMFFFKWHISHIFIKFQNAATLTVVC